MNHVRRRKNDIINERMARHYNLNRQGHRAKVSREQMYEMRYRSEFEGWKDRKISEFYGLEMRYVQQSVMGYRTMAGIVPVFGKPRLSR